MSLAEIIFIVLVFLCVVWGLSIGSAQPDVLIQNLWAATMLLFFVVRPVLFFLINWMAANRG